MKQISGFMSEITDEFKIIVVDAIRSLCLKFPAKQAVMLSFLSGVLRDEGGYDFKRAVVEAIFDMIKYISDCKETGKLAFADCVSSGLQLMNSCCLQHWHTSANSSRIANSRSYQSESCICSDWRDLRPSSLPSSSVIFITGWS